MADPPLLCPVCRARFRGASQCSRCGADLIPLMTLAARAYLLRRASRDHLLQGDYAGAQLLADRSQALHATDRGRHLSLAAAWFATCLPPEPPGRMWAKAVQFLRQTAKALVRSTAFLFPGRPQPPVQS